MDLHGGNIAVESLGDNRGCCFTVFWPVRSPDVDQRPSEKEQTFTVGSSLRTPALSPRKYVGFKAFEQCFYRMNKVWIDGVFVLHYYMSTLTLFPILFVDLLPLHPRGSLDTVCLCVYSIAHIGGR